MSSGLERSPQLLLLPFSTSWTLDQKATAKLGHTQQTLLSFYFYFLIYFAAYIHSSSQPIKKDSYLFLNICSIREQVTRGWMSDQHTPGPSPWTGRTIVRSTSMVHQIPWPGLGTNSEILECHLKSKQRALKTKMCTFASNKNYKMVNINKWRFT